VMAPIPASASLAATNSVPPTGGVYSAMERSLTLDRKELATY
jgi:hypothetical protein